MEISYLKAVKHWSSRVCFHGADLVSMNDPVGGRHRGTLEIYNGLSCAGGPVQKHSETDGGPFLEKIPPGTASPSRGGACPIYSQPEPMICNAGGSAWTSPTGIQLRLPP